MGKRRRLLSVCIWVNTVHGKKNQTPTRTTCDAMCTCAKKHTLHPSSVPLNFPIIAGQVYAADITQLFFRCVNHHRCHSLLTVYVCAYAGNICVFRVPLILPSRGYMRGGSSVCQHGASLTSWVLLKVLMEERLWGLCPLEPSCASVSPLLSAYSLFLVCLYWQLGGGQWTFR